MKLNVLNINFKSRVQSIYSYYFKYVSCFIFVKNESDYKQVKRNKNRHGQTKTKKREDELSNFRERL